MAKSNGLEIARGILEKYGWREGQGLGRNGGGMVSALQPKLKANTAGIGYSSVEKDKLTTCWWEKAYNAAAKEISITEGKSGVKMSSDSTKARSAFPIKHERRPFVKTSILTNRGTVRVKDSAQIEGETEEVNFSCLTDEAIFEACGKRTVHKGARHGLKLNGKLARLARQEELLVVRLPGLQGIGNNFNVQEGSERNVDINSHGRSVPKKMKYRKNDFCGEALSETNSNESTSKKEKSRYIDVCTETVVEDFSCTKRLRGEGNNFNVREGSERNVDINSHGRSVSKKMKYRKNDFCGEALSETNSYESTSKKEKSRYIDVCTETVVEDFSCTKSIIS